MRISHCFLFSLGDCGLFIASCFVLILWTCFAGERTRSDSVPAVLPAHLGLHSFPCTQAAQCGRCAAHHCRSRFLVLPPLLCTVSQLASSSCCFSPLVDLCRDSFFLQVVNPSSHKKAVTVCLHLSVFPVSHCIVFLYFCAV